MPPVPNPSDCISSSGRKRSKPKRKEMPRGVSLIYHSSKPFHYIFYLLGRKKFRRFKTSCSSSTSTSKTSSTTSKTSSTTSTNADCCTSTIWWNDGWIRFNGSPGNGLGCWNIYCQKRYYIIKYVLH